MGYAITSYKMDRRHIESMMTYRMVTAELKRFFHMPEASADEIQQERYRRLRDMPREYIQSLLSDASIKILMCDLDAPVSAYWTGRYRLDEDVEKFFWIVEPEVDTARVIRIETACNRILDQNLLFEEFCDTFKTRMEEGIKKYNVVALKSIIAYHTGLEISNPSREKAKKAYEKFIKNRNDFGSEKTWRDFMVHEGLKICKEYQMPLQIHTGWGDTPYGDLRRLSPKLLYDFLREEETLKIPIVLLHAGYPYVREMGILSSHFPNLYFDFSEMTPYAGMALETALPMLLETAPTTKILYGTDGGGIPEPVWFGAVYSKKVLAKVLGNIVEQGYMTSSEAYQAAESIMYRNALSLYPGLRKKSF